MRQPSTSRRVKKLALLLVINLMVLALVGAAGVVFAWAGLARGLPTLRGWHRAAPASEFVAKNEKGSSFADYLAREDAVFQELRALEGGTWAQEEVGPYCRYQPGSVCYHGTVLDRDWNRTFVFDSPDPAAGVLLIHGLSDSPYSLRSLGQSLHAAGCTVIGLRVPGHGTCPAALAKVEWEDWAAAVRVAVRSLRERVPAGAPLVLVGYSNGGALSVNYAAEALESDSLPRPDGLVLYSPMIGITPMAAFTELFPAASAISGEPKLAWSAVQPEIDPFKYSSWPINASLQGYRMTMRVEEQLAALAAAGRMGEFPPVLAVQSAVDSTVLVTRLIEGLMDRVSPGRGELVLFDVNRASWLDGLVDKGFEATLKPRLAHKNLPFVLTLVTNKSPETADLVAKTKRGDEVTEVDVGMAWPKGVFSLSHVAMPVPPDDPLYGTDGKAGQLPLGAMHARGEHGVLAFSEGLLMRERNNPFHTWTQTRVMEWIGGIVAARGKPRAN